MAPSQARAQARKRDDALDQGEAVGAMHGVPVTIKDAFGTEGLHPTFGHKFMSRHVPERNATAELMTEVTEGYSRPPSY